MFIVLYYVFEMSLTYKFFVLQHIFVIVAFCIAFCATIYFFLLLLLFNAKIMYLL